MANLQGLQHLEPLLLRCCLSLTAAFLGRQSLFRGWGRLLPHYLRRFTVAGCDPFLWLMAMCAKLEEARRTKTISSRL